VSDSARPPEMRPERAAFADLERLVRNLGEELAFFRRRALEAERRLRELTPEHAPAAGTPDQLRARVAELERENQDLRARLDEAASRTRQMAERIKFLRQQEGAAGER
jgi:chromosome segregation ATPase